MPDLIRQKLPTDVVGTLEKYLMCTKFWGHGSELEIEVSDIKKNMT